MRRSYCHRGIFYNQEILDYIDARLRETCNKCHLFYDEASKYGTNSYTLARIVIRTKNKEDVDEMLSSMKPMKYSYRYTHAVTFIMFESEFETHFSEYCRLEKELKQECSNWIKKNKLSPDDGNGIIEFYEMKIKKISLNRI